MPADKSYAPTGVTLMAAMVYDKTKVQDPADHLAGSCCHRSGRAQVGMNDPSQSGPTFPFIAGMMNYLGGVSAGREATSPR